SIPSAPGEPVLTSLKNPKVAAAVRLKKRAFRDDDRRFLVEGAQAVREALAAPARLETLFVTDPLDVLAVRASELGVEVHHVGEDLVRKLTSTVTPQGILGVAPYVDVTLDDLPSDGCLTILHEVRDPGNAGTVLRSADAAGGSGVVFTTSSVDVYNPKTVRASAGSVFHLPVVRGGGTREAVAHAKRSGHRVLAMDAHGSESLYSTDLAGPVAFVFGNEAHGLPQEVVAQADATVRVPHRGAAESLNLAAAATVCLFEHARRAVGKGADLEAIISAAAHDIRSPLTAMKGFGYALEKRWRDMDEEQRSMMLAGIVHDADRMDQIVHLLVDAARVAAGSLEPMRDQVDLADLVEALAELLARDPDHPPLVRVGDPGPYFVDKARIRTTILAFVESLVWFSGEGPIQIGAERRDGHLHLWAQRAGSRVDQQDAETLFAPRRPGTGSGSKIGLYVARGVAEAQGGRAWAEVNDGVLSFHVDLPLAP
ncbi:MAG: TrmH family RNA methyltransferase, partial [Actinomycetota bacterium]